MALSCVVMSATAKITLLASRGLVGALLLLPR